MRRWGKKKPPAGWDYIAPTLDALASELREVNSAPTGGKQKLESNWPIIQLNNQRTRYIYDMYSVHKKISRDLYLYCVKQKLVDQALVAKWKKPGFEKLCSVFVIDRRNFPFGTTAICRVPRKSLGNKIIFEANTGCRGCASGSGTSDIFGNKYGQRLARIQVLREEKLEAMYGSEANEASLKEGGDDIQEKQTSGSSGNSAPKAAGPWASMESSDDEEEELVDYGDDDDGGDDDGVVVVTGNSSGNGSKRRADVDDDNDDDEGIPPPKRMKN